MDRQKNERHTETDRWIDKQITERGKQKRQLERQKKGDKA